MDVSYVRILILKRNVQSSMTVVLTCFCSGIFLIRLCRPRETSANAFVYSCCCDIVQYNVMGFAE